MLITLAMPTSGAEPATFTPLESIVSLCYLSEYPSVLQKTLRVTFNHGNSNLTLCKELIIDQTLHWKYLLSRHRIPGFG